MEKNTQNELKLNEIEIAIAKNTNKVVKNAIDFLIKPHTIYNKNRALKLVASDIIGGFDISTKNSNDIDFEIVCKITTEKYLQLNEIKVIDLSKNITCSVNVFNEIYTELFLNTLKNIDTTTQKMLLSKSICYNLQQQPTLKNSIKYYKDNNLKVKFSDICTKQKLSIYQIFKQFATNVIDYLNKNTK